MSVRGYKLNALTHFSEHIMDALFHVFILFTALSALLQFIISKLYTSVMDQQVRGILDKSLDKEQITEMLEPVAEKGGLTVTQLQEMIGSNSILQSILQSMWNQTSQAELNGKVLQPGDDFAPFWEQRVRQYNAGEGGGAQIIVRESQHVQVNNNWIWRYAHTISILLFLGFIALVWIMRTSMELTSDQGYQIWTPTTNVLKNNLLLIFPAIIIAEGGFFEVVAKKFIPILPSDFLRLFSEILRSRSTATTPPPPHVTS